jgi:DNA (cytosine-5)-methyltransferase 1
MSELIALDLFCGAGGATRGLQHAGFRVVGVDIRPQPRYCGDVFIQADAMTFDVEGFDFVWASPPCQKYTALKTVWNYKDIHPDLIEPVREKLTQSGIPFVIENVEGAPLLHPIRLCGTGFNLGVTVYDGWRQLRRHRLFESNLPLDGIGCAHSGATIGIYGDHARDRRRKPGLRDRGTDFADSDKLNLGMAAMRMDWVGRWKELCEAIPPAYSEFIGRQIVGMIS